MKWKLINFQKGDNSPNVWFLKDQKVKRDVLKPYPEWVTETVVRKHDCSIFSLCAHCNNEHTWMGDKSFKTHATSCKKANKNMYYQYFRSQLFDFITTKTHKTIISLWISLSVMLWFTFLPHISPTLLQR